MPINILQNLTAIRQRISAAEKCYQCEPNSVRLLAVSKYKTVELIQAAVLAGQWSFGENYLQEALPKIMALANLSLDWHFIGTMQMNKTKLIAQYFNWVQSLTNIKMAQRLHNHRPDSLPPLNVCIQVNISMENSKTGINTAEVFDLASAVMELPRLKLRGLMGMPAPATDFATQRLAFAPLRLAYEQLKAQGFAIDTLSMGMTHDLEAAIAAGSTLVRVGEGIFGTRTKN